MIEQTLKAGISQSDNAEKLISHYLNRMHRNLFVSDERECENTAMWDAPFFGLDKVALYQALPLDKQYNVLKQCTQDLLLESYFIEKTGIAYSAKLVLLAPSIEEKQMFSFIGSDEATHLSWIAPYIPQNLTTQPQGALLSLMNEVVSLDNANILYYLVQIILEGWGLKHYRILSDNCTNPELKHILKTIVKDEALHHHAGKTFFSASQLSQSDKKIIKDILKSYCDLLRVGPQAAATALSLSQGGLNIAQTTKLFDEINTQESSANKLSLLYQLMSQPGMESIVSEIEREGYFKPYPAHMCAQILHSSAD